jgi:hypothetical protein
MKKHLFSYSVGALALVTALHGFWAHWWVAAFSQLAISVQFFGHLEVRKCTRIGKLFLAMSITLGVIAVILMMRNA